MGKNILNDRLLSINSSVSLSLIFRKKRNRSSQVSYMIYPSLLFLVVSQPQTLTANEKEVPKSLGSDDDAVSWVNECLRKAFTIDSITKELIHLWLKSLSQYTKSSGAEVRIFYFHLPK